MNYSNSEKSLYLKNAFDQYKSGNKPTPIYEKSLESILQDFSKIGMSADSIERLQKMHRRKFSPEPIGYPKPKDIAKLLLLNSLQSPELAHDPCQMGIIFTMNGMGSNPSYPWYWLAEDLAFDFVKTDPPTEIPHRIALPNTGFLILPLDSLKTSTGEIAAICYHLVQPGETPKFNLISRDKAKSSMSIPIKDNHDGYRLAWVGAEMSGYLLGGIVGLVFDDTARSLKVDTEGFDALMDEETEKNEADRCLSLLLSVLVYANQNESEATNQIAKSLGFGKPKENTKNLAFRPIYIGREYKSVIRQPGTGTHASPKMHWRRGHWKTVAVGEGRIGREWRFISPTLVMKDL
jgi:hypothetical protein